jgi:branched-chain amino acid aminotransferase
MAQSHFCYFNGDLVRFDEISLHVSDLLFQRGYGVFDYFRSRNGDIPWLDDYVERLFHSLALSGIEVNMDREQFKSLIRDLQQKNQLDNGAFKVIATGGYSANLESAIGQPNFMILNIPWKRPPEESFTKGVHLIRERFVRPNPEVKTLYYFNTLRLQRKLKEYNAIDVLYHTGLITEASRANLFFVTGGHIVTPANGILKGITRKQVLSMFPEIGEGDIEAERLYDFDEIFLTGTSRDVTPVVSVEGQKIGGGTPGPFTREIQAAFRANGW